MHRLLTLLLFAWMSITQAAPFHPAGRWEGQAQLSGQALPLTIDLARDAQGVWQGRITLPGRELAGAPLGDMKWQGQALSTTLSATLSAAFLVPPEPTPTLHLQWRNAQVASGTLSLNGLRAPVNLQRTGDAQIAPPPPPSLPIPDALLGRWVGRYELGGVPREVTLTLSRDAQGEGGGTLLIIGKRRNELKLDAVHLGPSLLRLEARGAGITVEGRWSPTAIDGHFEQGPFEAALPLRRPTGEGQ
ncbi:hypothetical protein HNQ51_000461 [Inhella inkyongensis]|uniref:General secretion pathway protein N n=1 Tax=Inhella inkyongensis TaxID=392593 RepID=A0A840S185_9BURK|nr:hypothetical protein [Inhella inkyongensis]MBB5203168.1 hypothetical protein [Inhella inkyongensis]